MSAYPNRFSPVYTENRSSVSPPRPMKHVYAACRLIGIDGSSTEPVNSCGHLISRDPRSSMYSASSGINQIRFHRSACPIVLKYVPFGLGTQTHASAETPTPFSETLEGFVFGSDCDISRFSCTASNGSRAGCVGGRIGPSGE